MPITITPITPTGHVGPGLWTSISTDFIGPLPSDAIYEIRACTDSEALNEIWRDNRLANNLHQINHQLMSNFDVQSSSELFAVADATTVFYNVRLVSGVTVLDTGQISVQWSNTEGQSQQIFRTTSILNAKPTGGGLTPAQATELTQSNLSSQLAISGPAIGQFLANVANAFVNPALFFVCPVAGPAALTGTGTLVPITTTLPTVLVGMMWTFSTVPPGVGRFNGFVTQYAQRALQLVARYQLNHNVGPIVNGEITDWVVDDTPWFFQRLFPSVIGYAVTPGFVVDVTWLTAAPTCG